MASQDVLRALFGNPARTAAQPISGKDLKVMQALYGGAQAKSYEPTLRERIGNAAYDALGRTGFAQRFRGDMEPVLDAVPGIGTALSAEDAAEAYESGRYADSGIAAASTLASLFPPAKLGAKALRKAVSEMEPTAARMARAKEMGFYTDMPLYHGSAREFSEFDPAQSGSTTRSVLSPLGVWVARDPVTAGFHSEIAARHLDQGQQIYPLLHRADKPGRVVLKGDESNNRIAGAILDAYEKGHDAILFENYNTPNGAPTRQIMVIRNPEQLRSIFAKFDPNKRDSPDLLATLAAAGAIGVVSGEMNRNPADGGEN